MTRHRRDAIVTLAVAATLFAATPVLGANVLPNVQRLYENAAYEQALALLDTVTSTPTIAEARVVFEYRALCLIALGRTEEASRAAEVLVRMNPMSTSSSADISPKLAALLHDARLRLAPQLVRERYARARNEFDQRSFESAADDFAAVTLMFDDESLQLSSQAALAEMRTLAREFLVLARAEVKPAPSADGGAPASPPAPEPAAPTILPPVAIQQRIPPLPDRLRREIPEGREGTLEILVGADGAVKEARVVTPVHPAFDANLLAAAKGWKYLPATRNGVRVPYTAIVTVKIGE